MPKSSVEIFFGNKMIRDVNNKKRGPRFRAALSFAGLAAAAVIAAAIVIAAAAETTVIIAHKTNPL